MTFTFKLARRIARLRRAPALLLPIVAACAAGGPTAISSDDNPPVEAGVAQQGPVIISPRSVTLETTQTVRFRAFESPVPGSSEVTGVEWTATGGSIAADGSYKPAATGSFQVVGRRKGNPHNPPDTAVVIVVPPQPTLVGIEVAPSAATVGAGLQKQFSVLGRLSDSTAVPIGATWSANGGTVEAGGLYTAGPTAGTYRVVATHEPTGLVDTAVVTVPAATLTSVTMTPGSVSLAAGQSQQFTVAGQMSDGTTTSIPVTYTATGGSISATGNYTAGPTEGTFRVIATADEGLADTSAVTITGAPPAPTLSSIVMTPASVSLGAGTTQQFSVTGTMSDGTTAAVSPRYSATGGTISASGLYTAGATAGLFRVIATAQGKADTSSVTVTVAATLASLTLAPASVSLTPGQTQQFSVTGTMSDGTAAAVSPSYSATGGLISVSGTYTAGATAGTFRVIATAQGKADTSTVTITAPPHAGSLLYNGDLESGGWPAGATSWQCVPGRVVVYSAASKPAGAPTPRKGTHAASFRVLDTDVAPCTPTENPRATVLAEKVFHPGDERWEAFSVYIPTTMPTISGGFFMLFENYGAPYHSSPPVAAYLANNNGQPIINFAGRYDAATTRNQTIASLPIVKGQWYDVLMHVKFSTSPTGGFFELCVNGQPITFTNGQTRMIEQTMLTGATAAGMNLQQYRTPGMFPDATIYFDEAKIGTTRAAVEIQGSGSTRLAATP